MSKDVTKEPVIKQFRVKLSDDEKVVKREKLTQVLDEVDEIEIKKDQAMDQFKEEIKAKWGAINNIRLELKVGEMRDVPCTREFRWETGEVLEIDDATGEILSRRAITDAERQLFLDEKP